jgi:uncharacterized cupin superfamily protein
LTRLNVFDDEPWDMHAEQMQVRGRFLGKPAGAEDLGATVYELAPGASGFHLHAHYGMEEMFVVLAGTPTLRTGDGEERLRRGDFVFMPKGGAGLHTFTNPSEEPARVLAWSTAPIPEVVVYPGLEKLYVVTRDPFEKGDDQGFVASFDWPPKE